MDLRFPLTVDILTMTKVFLDNPQQLLRKELSITLAQYRTLAFIEKAGEISPGVLANHLGQPLSKVSLNLGELVERGIIYLKTRQGTTKKYAVTDTGIRIFGACQKKIQEEYDRLLGFLDEDQVRAFETGCFATSLMDGAYSYFGDMPDRVYMVLHAFYLSERLFTKTSNGYGMNLNQFRVMLALLEAGKPQGYAEIRRLLLMPSATMADGVRSSCCADLIELRRIDGRSKCLVLTAKGEELASKLAIAVDDCLMNGIRESGSAERALYAKSATDIVNGERHHRFKEVSA